MAYNIYTVLITTHWLHSGWPLWHVCMQNI